MNLQVKASSLVNRTSFNSVLLTSSCLDSQYRQRIDSLDQLHRILIICLYKTSRETAKLLGILIVHRINMGVQSPKLDWVFSPSRFHTWSSIATELPEITQIIFVRDVRRCLLWLFWTVEHFVQVNLLRAEHRAALQNGWKEVEFILQQGCFTLWYKYIRIELRSLFFTSNLHSQSSF